MFYWILCFLSKVASDIGSIGRTINYCGCGLYYKDVMIVNGTLRVVSEWRHNFEHHSKVVNYAPRRTISDVFRVAASLTIVIHNHKLRSKCVYSTGHQTQVQGLSSRHRWHWCSLSASSGWIQTLELVIGGLYYKHIMIISDVSYHSP